MTELQNKVFGEQATNYTKYRKPYPPALYEQLFSLLSKSGIKVLDLACGNGRSTEPLVREGVAVFGCDHDPLMIEEAKSQAAQKNLAIDYQVSGADSLPYADEFFDAVTVGTAFHWFANPTALAEIKRVLKPGGLFFAYWTMVTGDYREGDAAINEIFQKYQWPRIPSELRDLDHILALLQENGLQNVQSTKISHIHHDTLEERLGLETTNSGYGLLSEEDKQNFLADLRAALTQALGDAADFKIQEEVWVGWGFKK